MDEKRLAQLEVERERLMKDIEEKQCAKRAGLRDWERMEREREAAQLRTELAEAALEKVSGEAGMAGTAY